MSQARWWWCWWWWWWFTDSFRICEKTDSLRKHVGNKERMKQNTYVTYVLFTLTRFECEFGPQYWSHSFGCGKYSRISKVCIIHYWLYWLPACKSFFLGGLPFISVNTSIKFPSKRPKTVLIQYCSTSLRTAQHMPREVVFRRILSSKKKIEPYLVDSWNLHLFFNLKKPTSWFYQIHRNLPHLIPSLGRDWGVKLPEILGAKGPVRIPRQCSMSCVVPPKVNRKTQITTKVPWWSNKR